jgi:hypothetical protein
MNTKILLTGLTVAVLSVGVFTSTRVFAQTSSDPTSSIVQKIAEKFGLNKSDVQAVFDQERSDRKADMESKFEAQLDQNVKDGKITEAQKQLIISKRKELETTRQSQMQNMQGKSPDEMKTAMEAKKSTMESERTALEDWAKQNGIDVKYLMGGFGMRGGSGHKGMGGPPAGFMPPNL